MEIVLCHIISDTFFAPFPHNMSTIQFLSFYTFGDERAEAFAREQHSRTRSIITCDPWIFFLAVAKNRTKCLYCCVSRKLIQLYARTCMRMYNVQYMYTYI